MRKYMLASAEDQGLLAKYADDDELKSLREEIALLRMIIQKTLADAQSDVEKINAYSKVSEYVVKVERLLKTCHTLDQSMGNLLAKSALRRLGQQLGQAIVERLTGIPNYESVVEALLGDMVRIIEEIDNGTPELAGRE
jgi:type I site-specific restriction endonuclease